MAYTISEHCKCGGAILIDRPKHRDSWAFLLQDFRDLHSKCVTPEISSDVIEEPGGDVYSSATIAGQHSQHELQIGFQRDQW